MAKKRSTVGGLPKDYFSREARRARAALRPDEESPGVILIREYKEHLAAEAKREAGNGDEPFGDEIPDHDRAALSIDPIRELIDQKVKMVKGKWCVKVSQSSNVLGITQHAMKGVIRRKLVKQTDSRCVGFAGEMDSD